MASTRALLLEPSSPSYPAELASVPSPPDDVFVRGRVELLLRAPRVAIVGTRSPTPYGEVQARHFAQVLAAAGAVIVSGMARGIDEAAHRGALDVEGATIAVLGSGVDRPWPDGDLARRMATEGLLLSEFAPGEGPRRHHFPLRNRIIAALSRAVVVIEAAHASGSLITARWANDQGRDVYALPGRVDHPMSRGCHRLLREGATLIESPEELLAEFGL
ncbi:MAG TPA: DNA-processing protein DprA, partial [Planctomycetota bacterium]|nr:DNA-processing protein DprA [Planctomycetota bacterium]